MLSGTALGRFVDHALRGVLHGFAAHEHPLMMVNLLLADAEFYRDCYTLPRILEWLQLVYGDRGVLRTDEKTPSEAIGDTLRGIASAETVRESATSLAYIYGSTDPPGSRSTFSDSRTVNAIYRRSRRVFYEERPRLILKETGIVPVGILGLKGAGKSTLLKCLTERDEEVHDVYGHFNTLSHEERSITPLQDPSFWEAEPMLLGFQHRGWNRKWPRRFFVGGLLRVSEAEELSRIGRPVFIHVSAPNAVRHDRARIRGRHIEVHASDDWLVELDAHRGGEWPGYETNDLGTLLSLAEYTIINDGSSSIDDLVEDILEYVDGRHIGGR